MWVFYTHPQLRESRGLVTTQYSIIGALTLTVAPADLKSMNENVVEHGQQDERKRRGKILTVRLLPSSSCRELTLHSGLHRSIVTIYVSPEQYPFHVHKGRLCQHSRFFEKAFHGSFEEATTGSMYLEEDGVEEFKLFEEWLYSGIFKCHKDCEEPSFLLIKLFCLAEKVGISSLQNVALDAIRDIATLRQVSVETPSTTHSVNVTPRNLFASKQVPVFSFQTPKATRSIPTPERPPPKYLPPATATAIRYAYQNTPERSPLRKLLADIFAYNVKPETLHEDLLSFPAEFMADVLLINMKRLPLRLNEEEADFDMNAEKYHIHDSSSTHEGGKQRIFEDMETSATRSEHGSSDVPVAEDAITEPEVDDGVEWGSFGCKPEPEPEPEPPAGDAHVNEDLGWGSFGRKGKKKGRKIREPDGSAFNLGE